LSLSYWDIYNHSQRLNWYNHAILFQALRIFDVWMNYKYDNLNQPNDLGYKIILDDIDVSHVEILVIIYLTIKYYHGLRFAKSFKDISNQKYSQSPYLEQAENFEYFLLSHVLDFAVYSPTLYEIFVNIYPDIPSNLLVSYAQNNMSSSILNTESTALTLELLLRDLLIFYCKDHNINNIPAKDLLLSFISSHIPSIEQYFQS